MKAPEAAFGLLLPCPKCGGKTKWVPRIVKRGREVGYFECTHCGAKSGDHSIAMVVDFTTIQINRSTRKVLAELKRPGDTYDSVILRMLAYLREQCEGRGVPINEFDRR